MFNTPMPRYTPTAIVLHWLTAILIVGSFGLGWTMVDIPGITPVKLRYFSWHKWVGITVLGLACIRLWWRLTHPIPAYPAGMPVWQRQAAHLLHGLLYVLIFATPISGYFYSLAAGVPVVYFGVLPLPVLMESSATWKPVLKQAHIAFNMTLLAAVVLHVGAALKHQFIDRDGVFKRMLP